MDLMETLNILRYNKKSRSQFNIACEIGSKRSHKAYKPIENIHIRIRVFCMYCKKKAMHVYKFIFCFGGFIKTGNFDKTVNV